jgi:hypothetical protein
LPHYCCPCGAACRHNFPHALRDETVFVVAGKKRRHRFAPHRKTPWINPTQVQRAWRGNTDVQVITDATGSIEYITKTINYNTNTTEPEKALLVKRVTRALSGLSEDHVASTSTRWPTRCSAAAKCRCGRR